MDFIWPLAGNTSLFQALRPSPLQEAFHLRPIEKVQPLAATSSEQSFGNVKNIDIRLSIAIRACWRQFVISLKTLAMSYIAGCASPSPHGLSCTSRSISKWKARCGREWVTSNRHSTKADRKTR
jgi:hypothetical protein